MSGSAHSDGRPHVPMAPTLLDEHEGYVPWQPTPGFPFAEPVENNDYEAARVAFAMERNTMIYPPVLGNWAGGFGTAPPASIDEALPTPTPTVQPGSIGVVGRAITSGFLIPPPGNRYNSYQFVLRRRADQYPLPLWGFRIAITPGIPGGIVTVIHAGGIVHGWNEYLRSYSTIGLDKRTLVPGNRVMAINGDTSHDEMKRHMMEGLTLHMLVYRIKPAVAAAAVVHRAGVGPDAVTYVTLPMVRDVPPPAATPLPRVLVPPPASPPDRRENIPPPPPTRVPPRPGMTIPLPPPRTSILGPGPWPSNAQDLCELFEEATNVEIDMDTAFMTHKISEVPDLQVWFALEVRRIWILGRPLNAHAHITLITGGRPVVEQTQNIADVLQDEFEHWRRMKTNGLTGRLRRPPEDFRCDKRHYSWLLILPGVGMYEKLNQAVALAQRAYVGPSSEIYPRRRYYHIRFETDMHAPS